MVQAMISITKDSNRTLNIIKAVHNLKNKSQAINVMAEEYSEIMFGPELKKEYINKLKQIKKEDTVPIKDFDKHFSGIK